ncbi:glycosyltransferase [Paenibacillus sp. FSL R5-0766]|uniref:tetratricopeptide repeat-containing glycosyltransferase n=1 Tax=unclassified Paenibacillus TaxID=185978 RepID=UPI00096D912B|nr:glycosyltransferase [Paenibacillus sp. FSL R5-0765]OMF59916.1 hypothetical protein BK141_23930 [Paenibacillus sp. FSL R5-0765]
MKITGCILTKNEAPLLEDAIRNLKKLTNNIIIVDNGSSDNTRQIAEKFECDIIISPQTILDQTRNVYLNAINSGWVFVLDTDERLDDRTITTIHNFCSQAPAEVMLARLPRYEYLGNGLFFESTMSRLFRSHPQIRYDPSPIHSSVTYSVKDLSGEIKFLDAPIQHIDVLVKQNSEMKRLSYTKLLEETLTQNEGTYYYMNLLMFLGVEYATSRDYDKALNIFDSILNSNRCTERMRYYVEFYKCRLFMLEGEFEKVKELVHVDQISDLYWKAKFLTLKAEILWINGDLENSKKCYYEALDINPNELQLLLNLAYLEKIENPQVTVDMINNAIKINSYLLEPIIYKNVDSTKNVFFFQKPIDLMNRNSTNIFECMIEALKSLEETNEINTWMNHQINCIA